MNSKSRSNHGFTLIEILIAITLIGFMSFGIYQILGQTYALRDVLLGDSDFYSEIRLAVGIIDRDVTSLFDPPINRRSGQPPTDLLQTYGSNANDRSAYWGPVVNRFGVRIPRFFGTPDSIQFVGTSHGRVYQDAAESIYSKIRYELKKDSAGGILLKTERTSAFAMEETDRDQKREYPLLGGVTKLVFKYFKRDKDQWSANWDSDRAETRDVYPDLIEMSLEVRDGEKKFFEGRFLLRPEAFREGLYATF